MKGKIAFLIGTLIFAGNAEAYDWVVKAHVTEIEVTYFPADIIFSLDAPEGNQTCKIIWDGSTAQGTSANKQVDNVKAVYATLLSAKSTGQPVLVFGSNPAAGSSYCIGNFIYSSSQ